MKIHRIIALSAVLTLPAMASLAQSGAILATGTFHGAVHKTSGRATVYQATGGNVLRLTHFSTSNGPNRARLAHRGRRCEGRRKLSYRESRSN